MRAFLFLSFLFVNFGFSDLMNMTLEEKIGQVLMVHFHGEVANDEARALVQEIQVGGIIYYNWANGLESYDQVRALSDSLQKLTETNRLAISLLLAVDQEGGLVNRLTKGFTCFPGNKALGVANNQDFVRKSAKAIGDELKSVGVNFNLAPVVDINNNPRNPIIGIRSFGADSEIVADLSKQALLGYQEASIITSLKHFPGHGDVEIDSHEDLPVLRKSKQELQEREFIPFIKLSSLADTIMTAHITVPSIDPTGACATLSKPILDVLRHEMGFNGVIITDSLVMEGVLKNSGSAEEASILAFNAGCDILLLGGKLLSDSFTGKELTLKDVRSIYYAMIQAVKQGRISEERLNESVQRIISLKERYGLCDKRKDLEISLEKHLQLAEQIAALSVEVVRMEKALCPSKVSIVAPNVLQSKFLELDLNVPIFFCDGDFDNQEALEAELVIFCSHNAWKDPKQLELIQELHAKARHFALLVTRDAYDKDLFPNVESVVMSHSPVSISLKAALAKLLSDF